MKSYFEALIILFNSISNLNKKFDIDYVSILNSKNEIAFESIYSNLNIPSFNNSAMDGYAFHFKQKNNFNSLNICYTITAGEFLEIDYLDYDFVIEIMTGARLPNLFNSVIKFEDVFLINKKYLEIKFINKIKINDNIKFIGEDIKKNFLVLEKGNVINLSHNLILSSIGLNNLNVCIKPNLYILCSGNEINNNFLKINYLKNVFIFDSISSYIYNFFKLFNFKVYNIGTTKDNFQFFFKKIQFLFLSKYLSIFLTVGAVSVGILDFIPKSLKLIGSKFFFHKVKIKPGKPILFGRINNYLYFFGLPGNPISSIVGIRFFVYPFLRFILGLSFEEPIKGFLTFNYNNIIIKKKNLFLKGFYYYKDAIIYVNILDEQESFKVNNMLISNCFIFLKNFNNSNNNNLLDLFFYYPNFYN